MTDVPGDRAQAQVLRWVEEGPTVLDSVRGLLREHTKLKMIAEATQEECERLRHEGDQLRADASRLAAQTERLQTVWAETTQWFTAMMHEATARLRSEHPPAVSGGRQ
jgi:predicted nuclease with TOPRIM domain